MSATETVAVTENLRSEIMDLYDKGLYLQAYELSKQAGPLKAWTGSKNRIVAARLANQTGSLRLARLQMRLAYQEDPTNPEVRYFYTYAMLSRRGPYRIYEMLAEQGDPETDDSIIQSDWLAMKGIVFGALRDFERADECINQALEIDDQRAWIHVQRSTILDMQDRRDEAIASAEHALQLQSWYRPAVQDLANRFVQRQRDDEAIKLLQEGIQRIESGDLRIQLGTLFLELERFEEAREMFRDIETYYPLLRMEPKTYEGLAAMNADLSYYCGDHDRAATEAKNAKQPFYDKFHERLTDESFEGKRVKLPVDFIRQNQFTCAPATLTMIAKYLGLEAEHLDVVEKICYDGTPAHSERHWADESGYYVREFRVDWDTAVQLLDQGIPFTLTTVDPGSSHLQAVIGYDEYRRSLLIRDPGDRHSREFDADKMLENYASNGPRGMLFIPKDKLPLLDGIKLLEADFYDDYYQLQRALEDHKREQAAQIVQSMEAKDPEHRMTLGAGYMVSRYDSDLSYTLRVVDKLRERYPKDLNLILARLACLSELGKPEDRLKTLNEICSEPDCDPMFWTQLAAEQISDSRKSDDVKYLLHRAIKFRGHDSSAYSLLGSLYIDEQKKRQGVDAIRFAACLDEKNEDRAKKYFYSARIMNETDIAMRFLEDRVSRFGKQSSQPARSLCWAHDQLEHVNKSLAVLKDAFQHHKDDGEFLLYTAGFFGTYGKFEKAEKLLAKAKDKCHASSWTRVAAMIATYQGKNSDALQYCQDLLKKDPLDYMAHQYVSGLLADEGGNHMAIGHLRSYVDRFPYSYPLRSMLIEWVRDEQPEVVKKELKQFLKLHPNDAWALREMSILYLGLRDLDKAEAYAKQAQKVDPGSAYVLQGKIYAERNQLEKAIQQYQTALKQTIDNDFAMASLIHCCNTKAEREQQLQFILNELKRQQGLGDAMLTYHSLAQSTLDSKKLYNTLHAFFKERQDCWQAWVAMCRQLTDMQKHEQSIKLATKGTKRFPLLPRMWMELASANSACGQTDAEIAALRRVKEINPTWGEATRNLAEALEKKGDLVAARKEIENVIRSEPRDVANLAFLASIMWDQDEKEDALQLVAKAVRMQPGFEHGWLMLRAWCEMLGKSDYDVEIATELTEKRPQEARSWMMLALAYDQPHQVQNAIDALDKAIAINPLNSECYSDKAVRLCQLGKYDEAIACTSPPAFGANQPIDLKARAAWIEAERGDFNKAVNDMEDVLRIDPDFFSAWQELAQWYRYLERRDEYHAAATQMIRVQPKNAVSWGYMGDAELAYDRLDTAKQHFQQAVQLAPTYSFASQRLMDLQIHEKDWEGAKATLTYIAPHLSPEWLVSEQARIAALSGDRATAFQKLEELCQMPSEDHSAIDGAVESMYLAGWKQDSLNLLTQQLESPNSPPGVAYVFVHLSTTMKKWDACEAKIRQLTSRPKHWRIAAQKFMEEAATAEDKTQQHRLTKFIRENEATLRNDTELWQQTGIALAQGDMDAQACQWMSDWRQRKQATGSGLLALACSLWDQKQHEEAYSVSKHVAANLPKDDHNSHHRQYVAFYELVYGDPNQAFEYIRDVDPMDFNPFFQLDYEYVICVLQGLGNQTPYGELSKQITAIWDQMDAELKELPILQQNYARIQWTVARLHGKKMKAWNWQRKI